MVHAGRALLLGAMVMLGAVWAEAAPPVDDRLYRDFGERAGLAAIVSDAIDHFATDDRIKDAFDNINLDWLKGRLTDELCVLTGGPCVYKGRNMAAAHKGLHLDTAHFNGLVEDLQDAMDRAHVPFRTQNRLLTLLAPMQRDIVTR